MVSEEEAAASGISEEDRAMRSRFWEAYDALSGRERGNRRMLEGITLAMGMQQAVFAAALALQDKRAVRNLSHFRWALLHNNLVSAEDRLLTQPLVISRLAGLLTDVSREERARGRGGWQPKPLVIFAERRNTFLGACVYMWGGARVCHACLTTRLITLKGPSP
jgi:hypothetical protein